MTATHFLQATCMLCHVPTPSAPDDKALCKVCSRGIERMRQMKPTWTDEVVRRMVSR